MANGEGTMVEVTALRTGQFVHRVPKIGIAEDAWERGIRQGLFVLSGSRPWLASPIFFGENGVKTGKK